MSEEQENKISFNKSIEKIKEDMLYDAGKSSQKCIADLEWDMGSFQYRSQHLWEMSTTL